MINIGSLMTPWAKFVSIYTQKGLKVEANIDTQILYYRAEEDMFDALLTGEIHIIAHTLNELPTKFPKGIQIGGVSDRKQIPSIVLVIPQRQYDENKLFGLKENANVWVNLNIQKAQLQEFRPDLVIEVKPLSAIDMLNTLQDNTFDAFLTTVATVDLLNLDKQDYHQHVFSPKEFIPEAGQGVIAALVASEDLATRKQLKQIHHPEIALVTNVERQLKQLFNDENIAAYCQHDEAGNFHLWAATLKEGNIKKTRLSQSTSFELAEKCFDVMNYKL